MLFHSLEILNQRTIGTKKLHLWLRVSADKNKAQQPLLLGDIYSKLLFSLKNYGVRFELVFCVEIAAHWK